jgi:transposase
VSSGRTNRHRLNRAGDRQANAALWRIVIVRLPSRHTPTIDHLEQRVTAGKSKRDAIRCLKRYLARELYNDIQGIIATTKPRCQIAA